MQAASGLLPVLRPRSWTKPGKQGAFAFPMPKLGVEFPIPFPVPRFLIPVSAAR